MACAAMNTSPSTMIINEAMRLNVMPKADEFKTGKVTLADIKKRVEGKKEKAACSRAGCCKNKDKEAAAAK